MDNHRFYGSSSSSSSNNNNTFLHHHSLMVDTEKTDQHYQYSPNILHLRFQNHREIMTEQLQEDHVVDNNDVQFISPRPSSCDTMFPTPCPDSPWTISSTLPINPSPSSLLYHCIASLHRHEGSIYAIAASKGLVFTGTSSSRIHVWKQPDCMDKGCLKASSGEVRAILAHSNMLFSTHKDHKIRVWNFTTVSSETFRSKKVTTLPRKTSLLFPMFPIRGSNNNNNHHHTQKHKNSVSCMAYYHSEGLLYTGSHDRTVKAWKVSERKCVDSFVAHDDCINSMLVNQDDGSLFTSSSDGSVKIWRRVYTEYSHTLTMTLKFQPSPVNALALSSSFSNCFLYSGSSDGMINFWEKERLCYRFNHGGFLQGHRFGVLCLATVGSSMLFSGSEDTTIRVWRRDQVSGYHECLGVLDGHRGPVRCLAACLEMEKVVKGLLVYSASLDQTFKVWRIKVADDDDDDENVCLEYGGAAHQRGGRGSKLLNMEYGYDMSPVLSPSWVEKKLQGSNFQ